MTADEAKSPPQVFLSYARADAIKVERLYRRLSEVGFKPWRDTEDLDGGSDWRRTIAREIRRSRFFVACLTKSYVNREGMIQVEIKEALEAQKERRSDNVFIVPVWLENCDIPEDLASFNCIRLYERGGWRRLVQTLQDYASGVPSQGSRTTRSQSSELQHIPLLVVINRNQRELESVIHDVDHTLARKRPPGLARDLEWDLTLDKRIVWREGALNPRPKDIWVQVLDEFEAKIRDLKADHPGRVLFHLFLLCPVGLAVGIGAKIRDLYPVLVYHWQQDKYVPVLDFRADSNKTNPRVLRHPLEPPFETIKFTGPASSADEVVVAASLSAQDASPGAKQLAESLQSATRTVATAQIADRSGGHIGTDTSWTPVVQDVYSALRQIPGGGRLHLCLASPVPIGCGVGILLGVRTPITVYQWFSGSEGYQPVLDLETLHGTPHAG